MNKWIIGLAVLAMLLITVIAGCGAQMPTVAEGNQSDSGDTKLEFNTDYTGNEYVIEAVD